MHDRTIQLHSRFPRHAHRQIAFRADRFMRENLEERLNLEAICRAARCGRKTLRAAFKSAFGMNPVSYFRVLRLLEARRRILDVGQLHVRITDIAADCGFSHLGHFGVAYKLQFGETPSETRIKPLYIRQVELLRAATSTLENIRAANPVRRSA